MTVDQFITKWNGRGIDFDGYYGDQCMDLMHQYHVDVLGIADGRTLAAGYAKDVYVNFANVFNRDKFERIANTPTGVPQKGDIMFWDANVKNVTGIAGHVAIFVDGNANKFRSFDQNYPTGAKCKIVEHSYSGVLGWLRPKTIPVTGGGGSMANYKGYDLANPESMKVAVDILVRVQAGEFVEKKEVEGIKAERDAARADASSKQTTIDNLNQQINDRNNDIVALNGKVSTLTTQVTDLNKSVVTLTKQAEKVPALEIEKTALEEKVLTYQEAEKTWNRAKAQYVKEIADLKKNSLTSFVTGILDKLFGKK